MAENAEDGANLTRVTGDGDVRPLGGGEDAVKSSLRAPILRTVRLRCHTVPVWILLRKARLERPRGEVVVDVRLVAPAVTRVDRDPLAKKFLNGGHEGLAAWECQAGECNVGC